MLQYAITDRHLGRSPGRIPPPQALAELLQRSAALATRGIDFLLIREKDLPAATLLAFTRSVVEAFGRAHAPTRSLVAARPDIALSAGAHGVHLSSSPRDLTPAQVRQVFPAAFVSRSCHTLPEVEHARDQRADAILFGPVFGKTVAGRQVSAPLGLEALQQACRLAAPTPVFALGGITSASTPQCLAAGAAGIAAIRMFFHP